MQQAFAAQRAFISDAAHELRSPLTALRLQLQLLDRAPDEAARLEARGRLGAAVERAIHLVEQLLTLARSDPQELAGDFEPVDLAAAAAEGITDTHDLALARGIDLGLDAAPGIVVRGDREALRIAGAKSGRQCRALHAAARIRAGALPLHGRGCAARGRAIRDPASLRPIGSGCSTAFIDAGPRRKAARAWGWPS